MMTTRLVRRPKIGPQQASKDPLERLRENSRRPVPPVSFAYALSALLTEQRRTNRSRLQRIRAAWAMALEQCRGVSAEALKRTEIRSVAKSGAVRVIVDSPALKHELGVVYREKLLAHVRELLTGKDSISELQVQTRSRRK